MPGPEIRLVTGTAKDGDGDITALCGDGWWSPRQKLDAVADNESGSVVYLVPGVNDVPVAVVVKRDRSVTDGVYLTTDPDGHPLNNLDDLPDC